MFLLKAQSLDNGMLLFLDYRSEIGSFDHYPTLPHGNPSEKHWSETNSSLCHWLSNEPWCYSVLTPTGGVKKTKQSKVSHTRIAREFLKHVNVEFLSFEKKSQNKLFELASLSFPQRFQVTVHWWRSRRSHAGNHRQIHGHFAQEVMSAGTYVKLSVPPSC